VIGGGLAGPEAALTAARLGCAVDLYEMRAVVEGKPRLTPAHQTTEFGELVCSNSLKSESPNTAPWLLKQEMRRAGSALLHIADETAVPAGHALAVDRVEFSRRITEAIAAEPLIRVIREEVTQLDETDAGTLNILATGPLTSDALSREIERITGSGHLAFYDSISPIVDAETIDMDRVYMAARWDKGTADYINCPMNREEFDRFLDALLEAEAAEAKEWEKLDYFEGCLPIEVLARRGRDTLRFGPMKPVGLRDPRTGRTPWAVVQLRKENVRADSYNLVGFQNHLKFGEQARVLRLIPGLENARFLRYGQIHRNTYIQAPLLLDETLRLKSEGAPSFPRTLVERVGVQNIMFAGQLSGVEGYTESIATGLLVGIYAGKNQCLLRVQAPWVRWCTTLRTPIRKTFSRPTSPSTCWSHSKRNCARKSAIRKSGTGWCASGRWLHSTRGGVRGRIRRRNFAITFESAWRWDLEGICLRATEKVEKETIGGSTCGRG
jgi:methylenetetrahydrofolate--tRNA-(uracil-5-)-methyltransferase